MQDASCGTKKKEAAKAWMEAVKIGLKDPNIYRIGNKINSKETT